MTSAAVSLEGVTFGYQAAQPVLSSLDLAIAAGEVVAVLGPSGSGKSTVLRLVLGFAPPSAGRIALAGEVASDRGRVIIPPEERRLAVVFQDLALWPHLTVRRNLSFVLESRRVRRDEHSDRIDAIFSRLGLEKKGDRFPAELSGGERQRAAIARALVLDPLAVLLDEPLSNLDAPLRADLLALFRELFAERNTTAIYVTHDLREAALLADRIAVLEEGRIVQDGTFDELRTRPITDFIRRMLELA